MNDRQIATIERTNYACKLLNSENIPYEVKKIEIGHINIYKNDKVVMSYWAYTGKCYIPSLNYKERTGIKNAIKKYNKEFGNNE